MEEINTSEKINIERGGADEKMGESFVGAVDNGGVLDPDNLAYAKGAKHII